ncbi:MAG: carboxylating nicotinate-nucleotide diphosphorylase [Gammaproteobacteria bacterium]
MIDGQDIPETVARALAEDVGGGDITALQIPPGQATLARIVCRQEAVLCGTAWCEEVFRQLDRGIVVGWQRDDGEALTPNQLVCELRGPTRGMLTGERTALNFLQTLSAVATATRGYVDAVAHTQARILDTRKTLPGLRRAQKYAVTCGGGHNHRMGLYDAVLLKENHIMAAGSIEAAVEQSRARQPGASIEVEVETVDEFRRARAAGADVVMLDNFSLDEIRRAVAINQREVKLEVSGGITHDSVVQIAETGVDYISVGALTKDVDAVDFSMRFDPA